MNDTAETLPEPDPTTPITSPPWPKKLAAVLAANQITTLEKTPKTRTDARKLEGCCEVYARDIARYGRAFWGAQ